MRTAVLALPTLVQSAGLEIQKIHLQAAGARAYKMVNLLQVFWTNVDWRYQCSVSGM